MNEIKTLSDVANKLYMPNDSHPVTVREIVSCLIELAEDPKVYVKYDGYDDSYFDFPNDFLQQEISQADNDEDNEEYYRDIIDAANNIIPAYIRELDEDDIESIKEDIRYRGGDPEAYGYK